MPPNAPEPPEPKGESSPPPKPGTDLDSILLPKKEPAAGPRINAGILFNEEQRATLVSPAPAPASAPATKREPPAVTPLQTYKGDIEQLVQSKNLSVIDIAAAEAEKRARASRAEIVAAEAGGGFGSFVRNALMMLGGLSLIAAAGGLGYIAYYKLTATVPIPEEIRTPFIVVDKTTVVAVPQASVDHAHLMPALEQAKQASAVALGLIERLLPVSTFMAEGEEVRAAIPVALLLPALAPHVPEELVRTLGKEYLLGTHLFDGPQAFLMLETDSYERAFAAMLIWEEAMRDDLAPLFTRTPRPRIPEEGIAPHATTTATSTPERPAFVDRIVENRDTRVLTNEYGDVLLLWAFLDRSTLVITTNEYTFRELVARASAPVTEGL